MPFKSGLFAIALVLVVTAGGLNRWVRSSRANTSLLQTPLALPLAEIPVQIGPYVARDVELSEDILRVAAVDEFIHREYFDPDSGRRLLVYIGYWGRENVGMGHGPEVCYPAAGWGVDAPARRETVSFQSPQTVLNATTAMHRFVRTEPEGVARCAVGFVSVVSGEYQPSSRGVFWHRPGHSRPEGGHYLTHVHVSAFPPTNGWEKADTDILRFMKHLLPELSKCLPQATAP